MKRKKQREQHDDDDDDDNDLDHYEATKELLRNNSIWACNGQRA